MLEAHNDSLARRATAALTGALAANVSLVNFNMAGKQGFDFALVHLFADFVADPPSGLVGDAQLALELLGGNAVTRGYKEVDRIEPRLQRRPRVLKDGAGGWIDVVATGRAGPSAAIAHAVERAFDAAGLANVTIPEANAEDVFKAGFIIGEALEELADAESGGC